MEELASLIEKGNLNNAKYQNRTHITFISSSYLHLGKSTKPIKLKCSICKSCRWIFMLKKICFRVFRNGWVMLYDWSLKVLVLPDQNYLMICEQFCALEICKASGQDERVCFKLPKPINKIFCSNLLRCPFGRDRSNFTPANMDTCECRFQNSKEGVACYFKVLRWKFCNIFDRKWCIKKWKKLLLR